MLYGSVQRFSVGKYANFISYSDSAWSIYSWQKQEPKQNHYNKAFNRLGPNTGKIMGYQGIFIDILHK
jgi:hypothetical protein